MVVRIPTISVKRTEMRPNRPDDLLRRVGDTCVEYPVTVPVAAVVADKSTKTLKYRNKHMTWNGSGCELS